MSTKSASEGSVFPLIKLLEPKSVSHLTIICSSNSVASLFSLLLEKKINLNYLIFFKCCDTILERNIYNF